MKRLLGCILGDVKIQVKYGLYTIYFFVTIIYILFIRQLPSDWLKMLLPVIIFSDPAMLGLFFSSGLLFFEKDEGTLSYLQSCPLRKWEYICSKFVSLSIISLITSCSIAAFSNQFVNYFYLVLAVGLASAWFILLGILLTFWSKRLYSFLVIAVLTTVVISLPLLDYFSIVKSNIFYILPSYPIIILLRSAFGSVNSIQVVYSGVYISILTICFFVMSIKNLKKFVIKTT